MSENTRHGAAILSLRNALELHFRNREDLLVTGDLLLYWKEGDAGKSVGPDVIVAFGVSPGHRSSYMVWKEGKVPDFVMEVSSPASRDKDRTDKRDLYESLGIPEYFLYDPGYAGRAREIRAYRIWGGRYVEELRAGSEEVRSEVLGLGFRGEGDLVRVRDLGTGQDLPTHLELARDLTVEVRARRAAEARVKELEALLRSPSTDASLNDSSD